MAATVWIYFRIMHMNGYGTIADNSFKGVLDSSFAMPMFKLTETCILLGFIPPAILHVIGWLKTLPQRFGRDIREAAALRRSKATWTKYEEYERDQRSEERQRLAKISQTPNGYRCAADGCGIQAFHKGALRRCGGRCPAHEKPHYCSAYCQRNVRISTRIYVQELNCGLNCRSTGSSIGILVIPRERMTLWTTTETRIGRIWALISQCTVTEPLRHLKCGAAGGRVGRSSSTFQSQAGIGQVRCIECGRVHSAQPSCDPTGSSGSWTT